MFPSDAVIVTGKLDTFSYRSQAGSEVTKASCANCGSPIFGSNTRSPDCLTLTLGTMDDGSGFEIEVAIFTKDKQHWDRLGEDVSVFAAQPDWSPDS